MTQQLLDKPAQASVGATHVVDPEALIEEARHRARRRRLRSLATVLTLIAIGGGAYGISRSSATTPLRSSTFQTGRS